jgi:hypothetical protein
MTTSTKDLIAELMQAHKGHADEGVSTFSEAAQRLRELDAQVTSLELNILTERGAKAWKDVPNATDFVEELRGNSDKPNCVWKPLITTVETKVNFYAQSCTPNIMVREMPTKLTSFCSKCDGAVKDAT